MTRLRNVNFEVSLQGRPLGEIEQIVQVLPSLRELPRGIQQTAAGDVDEMAALATSFGMAMLTGVCSVTEGECRAVKEPVVTQRSEGRRRYRG